MYLFVAFLAVLGWHIVSELMHRHDVSVMLNRIMAKNYQEFEYYDKKYQTDLKEVEKIRDEERVVRERTPITEKDFESDVPENVRRFLDTTDSDWRPDEVDIDKVKSIIGDVNEPAQDRG